MTHLHICMQVWFLYSEMSLIKRRIENAHSAVNYKLKHDRNWSLKETWQRVQIKLCEWVSDRTWMNYKCNHEILTYSSKNSNLSFWPRKISLTSSFFLVIKPTSILIYENVGWSTYFTSKHCSKHVKYELTVSQDGMAAQRSSRRPVSKWPQTENSYCKQLINFYSWHAVRIVTQCA